MPTSDNVIQVIINGKNNAAPAFKSATKMIATFGAVSVAALTAATIRAGKFERGMAEIATLLDGDVAPAIEDMRKEIMDLSVEFGQAIGKMTKARYDVISAGFTDAAESAEVLRVASTLAVSGVADVAQTADLLTTALNGMGKGAEDAAWAADILFQIVRKGKTTIPELAQSMGPLFATSKTAGIGLEELGAVMATLTAAGINTAESVTSLNQLMLALAAPSGEAKKVLDEMGLSLKDGLVPALTQLSTVSEEGLAALQKIIPNIRALKAAGTAAGNIEVLTSNLAAMADAAGVNEEAFGKMSETFDFKMNQATAAVDALVISVGTQLLPTFTSIVEKFILASALVGFLAEETETGERRWKSYWEELKNVSPVLDATARAVGWIGDRFKEMNDAIDENTKTKEFNNRVTAEMERLMKSGEVVMQPWHQLFNSLDSLNNAELRAYAESIIRFQDVLAESPPEDGLLPETEKRARTVADVIREAIAKMNELKKVSESTAAVLPDIPPPTPRGKIAGDVEIIPEIDEDVERLREQLESLSKFTKEDFADMAFSIGDSFAMVATDVGAHLLGLAEGPIMLGRMFKQMAISILSDLARMISRMLVAQALMSVLGLGVPAVAVGAVGATTMMTGGTVPMAASGMIVPGSPGLDRSLVLAHGGEVMIPRQEVEGIDRARKRAQAAPPPARRSRRAAPGLAKNYQLLRPLRREEQNLLNDSVTEAEDRAKRNRG